MHDFGISQIVVSVRAFGSGYNLNQSHWEFAYKYKCVTAGKMKKILRWTLLKHCDCQKEEENHTGIIWVDHFHDKY